MLCCSSSYHLEHGKKSKDLSDLFKRQIMVATRWGENIFETAHLDGWSRYAAHRTIQRWLQTAGTSHLRQGVRQPGAIDDKKSEMKS